MSDKRNNYEHVAQLLHHAVELLNRCRNDTIEDCAQELEWLIEQEDIEVSKWPAVIREVKDRL